MKYFIATIYLTILCFLLLSNVHAWEMPSCLRVSGGSGMWFTTLQGDLIQSDRTKLDLTENLGLKRDDLVWTFFAEARIKNIHVLRVRAEPYSAYEQSGGDSSLRVKDARIGYDLDFYMSPQLLFGANVDLDILNVDTRVRNVVVANSTFNYNDSSTRAIPTLGFHAIFYPIMNGISLRPTATARVNWWSYGTLESWDWKAGGGVDIPVTNLWTWSVNAGYRFWHLKFKRDTDTLDMNRSGFFLESSLLF
jgi:hypothetical protein